MVCVLGRGEWIVGCVASFIQCICCAQLPTTFLPASVIQRVATDRHPTTHIHTCRSLLAHSPGTTCAATAVVVVVQGAEVVEALLLLLDTLWAAGALLPTPATAVASGPLPSLWCCWRWWCY